jgi:hypothetical protein
VRWGVNKNFDKRGLGTALIISNAKAPWDVLANPVGSDMMRSIPTYPLNFRRLQLSLTSRRAPLQMDISPDIVR